MYSTQLNSNLGYKIKKLISETGGYARILLDSTRFTTLYIGTISTINCGGTIYGDGAQIVDLGHVTKKDYTLDISAYNEIMLTVTSNSTYSSYMENIILR